MGLRRLCFLLVLTVVACGDNDHPRVPGDGPGDTVVVGDGSDGGSGSDGGKMDAGIDAPCNAPNIICSGQCIDPNTTDTHCGGCGTDCTLNTTNTACVSGICCAPGQINSNGNCCDTGQHWDNGICCNGTDVNVGTAQAPLCCASGDIDSNGHCCASGQHYDNGTCCNGTDVNVGGAANPLCCPDGTYLDCNNTCVPAGGNDMNCGGCPLAGGTDCTLTSQYCSSGLCCTSPAVNTNGKCCQPGEFNIGGGATGTCCPSASDIVCGGMCVDPQTDNSSCGGCVGGTPNGVDCTQGGTSSDVCLQGICCASGDHISNGICCPSGTDNMGGICCTPTQHNSGGICCGPNTDNVGGTPPICCASGFSNCNGVCVNVLLNDNNNCGGCGTVCPTTCLSGHCCPSNSGEEICGGQCSNPGGDNANCGGCGIACSGTNNTCTSGICCPANSVNSGGHCCPSGQHYDNGICCASGQDNCGGSCVNRQTDPNNCGTCTNKCGSLQTCSSGVCSSTCNSPNTACLSDVPPVCTNLNNDPNNCMTCGNVCATGATCNSGACTCPTGDVVCAGACTDTTTDPNNCGGCAGSGGTACSIGEQCQTGHCCGLGTIYCSVSNTCSDLVDDPLNCGSCGNACGSGAQCVNGTCQCAAGDISCGGNCISPTVDPNNCGSCGNVCGAGVNAGRCSTSNAPCKVNTDCTGAQTCVGAKNFCVSNSCTNKCPAPLCQEVVGGVSQCINPVDDNHHCGASINNDICSGGTDCTQAGGHCSVTTTTKCSIDDDCAAGQTCIGGHVCSNGSCVTSISTTENSTLTAKCVGGGPPIVVPQFNCSILTNQPCGDATDCSKVCSTTNKACTVTGDCPSGETCTRTQTCVMGSGTTCAGNLADTAFTFGLCTCKDIGPLSRLLQTDGFDSSVGSYVGPGWGSTACNSDADCGISCDKDFKPCAVDANCAKVGHCSTTTTTACNVNTDCPGTETCVSGQKCDRTEIKCINNTCAAGGVATDGTESDTADTDIGGRFYMWLNNGVEAGGTGTKGNVNVLLGLFNNGPYQYSKTTTVYGSSDVKGNFSTQGNSNAVFGVSPNAIVLEAPQCTGSAPQYALPPSLTLFGTCTTATEPITQPCCGQGYKINVKGIVQFYSQPANNDDANLGITPALFDNPSGTIRLDLPCGNYYFHSFNGSGATITVYVHGHVGLFISGAVRISQTVIFDLDPDATLDIFAGGVLNVSQSTFLGSPAFPRQTRMYFGSGSCGGGSATCSVAEDCCGGVCSGGTCQGGGGNLSQAISLSNSGAFNGLLWAGYGTFTHSNPFTMYGAIFANQFDASGDTTIHYDNGIVNAPNECPPPPVGGVCDTYRDCNNNPCVSGTCHNCTFNTDCPAGLTCQSGNCKLP